METFDVVIASPEYVGPWELDVPATSAGAAGRLALYALAGRYGVALETAVVVVNGERQWTPADGAMCRYFARCDRRADGTVAHPVLGAVPTCQRCADRVGVTIT